MGMSDFYGPADRNASVQMLQRAVELGVDFFDTADAYGSGHNETLVGEALKPFLADITVATKFGFLRGDNGEWLGLDCSPERVAAACDQSLSRMGIETIDLYYAHRVDPNVPVEDTVGAMAKLVEAGKVQQIGLSEATADELRRAHAVHPITALQSELSPWTRDPVGEIIDTCGELGVSFVAYSPLGRGYLTGAITSREDLAEGDYRLRTPRFQEDALEANRRFVEILAEVGGESYSPAQIALAWVLDQAQCVCAIPGTRSEARLLENLGALAVDLDAAMSARLGSELPSAVGARY
jgi:aryl-alcohol dehydrogenase-like predicted oxidoreductase